jgi:hypothetical protein
MEDKDRVNRVNKTCLLKRDWVIRINLLLMSVILSALVKIIRDTMVSLTLSPLSTRPDKVRDNLNPVFRVNRTNRLKVKVKPPLPLLMEQVSYPPVRTVILITPILNTLTLNILM